MLRMRFPAVCLSSAALAAFALSAPAFAQSGPASAAKPAPPAKIDDIQVSRDGDTVSILVKLSQQPTAASAKSSGETLTLDVDGLTLSPLTLSPPPGAMVTGVRASSGTITLSGAALDHATTVIYRNAILIEAKYAEPSLRSGSSLMKGATPTPATPPAQAIASPPIQPAVSAPVQTAAAPPPAQPLTPPPVQIAAATPTPPKTTPVALTPPTSTAPIALPSPTAKPPQPTADLQSHPAPTPVTVVALPNASIAGIDAARCSAADAELKKDAWALGAMGDQALCLLDAGKYDEGKAKLDQLAAITPLDWRVALGLAVLQDHKGQKDLAKDAWLAAIDRAPTDTIRAAIKARIDASTARTS